MLNLLILHFQCAIPAFEGLLPEPHNQIVMTLLYRLAEWHALAKLRMHTETTLTHLEKATSLLGDQMRRFQRETCPAYKTTELPNENAARVKRAARKAHAAAETAARKEGSNGEPSAPVAANADPILPPSEPASAPVSTTLDPRSAPRETMGKTGKKLNLNTYKFHALGDYVRTIRMLGTTDSYSTQPVSEMCCSIPKAC